MWSKNLKILKDQQGVNYYSILPNKKIKNQNNDIYVSVKSNETLHDLANKYYGDPKLWIIIAQANNLMLPFNIPYNQIIRIPSKNTI